MGETLTVITEGGKNLGFGHISRCVSIVSVFEKRYNIKFLINGDKTIESLLKNFDFEIFDWRDNQNLILKVQKSDLILLDSIQISNKQIKQLENTKIPIIFIDDEKRRNILDSGYVVDWTILSEKQGHFKPKKADVLYLLGSKYTPLRSEFIHAKRCTIRKNIDSFLLTFGGSDIRNITPKILKILNKNFPQATKNVIIGNGYSNIDDILHTKDSKTNLIFDADAKVMTKCMQDSDVAIASGGQTLYELACMGLPSLSILIVDNAKDDTFGWDEIGGIKFVSWWDDKEIERKLLDKISSVQSKKTRQYLSNLLKSHIDGKGAELLLREVVNDTF